jgi:hypothetical protein
MATSISVRISSSISANIFLLFAAFRRFTAVGDGEDRNGEPDLKEHVLRASLLLVRFLEFIEECRDKDAGSDEKLAREALE